METNEVRAPPPLPLTLLHTGLRESVLRAVRKSASEFLPDVKAV